MEALTAAAAGLAPVKPPASWFQPPALNGPQPLTVTDEGQVYGHAWQWDSCHTGFPGACVTAPKSRTGYKFFHLGQVRTAEGETVDTGRITLDTGHADRRLGSDAAADHYDHTGAVVADVRVGEDRYGGWVAGAVRPSADAERIREFMAAPVSGDWRAINGSLELIGLLAVNVPGFPVPRPVAVVAAGMPEDAEARLTLLAAGIVVKPQPSQRELDAALTALAARAEGGLDGLLRAAGV